MINSVILNKLKYILLKLFTLNIIFLNILRKKYCLPLYILMQYSILFLNSRIQISLKFLEKVNLHYVTIE